MAAARFPRSIAPGVSQLSVGAPFASHVYLIEADDGVIAFDTGVKGAGPAILAAAGGELQRVILSHAHVDHRGAARELGAPVYCHPEEVTDVEGDAGHRYTKFDPIAADRTRQALPALHAQWDGGPVQVTGTLSEGEQIAGFRVIHAPGHAPGQIALFRDSDHLLLAADAIYTFDVETGRPAPAAVPHPFANWDTEIARESIRKLSRLDPRAVWLGHADPLIGPHLGIQLERTANHRFESPSG